MRKYRIIIGVSWFSPVYRLQYKLRWFWITLAYISINHHNDNHIEEVKIWERKFKVKVIGGYYGR